MTGQEQLVAGEFGKEVYNRFFFFKYFQEGVNCNEHKFLIDVVSMIL